MTDSTAVLMTQQGYDELKKELEEIKSTKLPAAIQRVATARSFGDLSENAEYHAAREDLAMLEGRIAELEDLLQRAQVATGSDSGEVAVGSKVIVTLDGKSQEHTFHIVGEWEADPSLKKISEKSPLGQALTGRKTGEKVVFEAPAGKIVYIIKSVA